MTKPQTIKIFLPDGTPKGIREAEVPNRLVLAMHFSRGRMKEAAQRYVKNDAGIYLLFGVSEETAQPMVYIGEGEDVFKRIRSHKRKKDFWTDGVVITDKTHAFSKTDIKFLEHHSLQTAKEIGRYEVDNNNEPGATAISESREYELLDTFETISLLLSAIGYPIFDPRPEDDADQVQEPFLLNGQGIQAQGYLNDEGFVVLKGSTAKASEVPSCPDYLVAMRQRLVKDEVLSRKGDVMIFNQSKTFNSPSTAGGVVLGRATNGWTKWKSTGGKTLDEEMRA